MNGKSFIPNLLLAFITGIFFSASVYLTFTELTSDYRNGINLLVFSWIGTILFLSCFLLSKENKINVIIVSITSGFCLFMLNIALAIFSNFEASRINTSHRVERAKERGIDFDTRTKIEVLQEQRKKSETWPSVHPTTFLKEKPHVFFPLAGISKSNTVYCNELGYYLIYHSDRYGFNNPNPSWDRKNEIALIGDSFIHGACVSPQHSLSGLLSDKFNHKTIALGYGGNGPLIELATLLEYLPKVKVENVIWSYYEGNDLINLEEESENEILMKYLNSSSFNQQLPSIQKKVDTYLQEVSNKHEKDYIKTEQGAINQLAQTVNSSNWLSKLSFKKLLSLWFLRKRIGLSRAQPGPLDTFYDKATEPRAPQTLEMFKKILTKAKETSRENGAQFYFLYLPEFERYLPEFKDYKFRHNGVSYRQKEEVLKLVRGLNIPIIDFSEHIQDKAPLSLFPYQTHGHYNHEGYEELAKLIYQRFKK